MQSEFVRIPAAEARIGATLEEQVPADAPDFWADQSPAHVVALAGFELAREPLTNVEYAHFLRHGFDLIEHHRLLLKDLGPRALQEAKRSWRDQTDALGPLTWRDGTFPPGAEKDPVSGISFYEAAACASYYRARLPSELEWEAAARLTSCSLIAPVWQWTTSHYAAYPGAALRIVHDLTPLHRVARGGPIEPGPLTTRFPLHPWQRFAGLGMRLARHEGDQ